MKQKIKKYFKTLFKILEKPEMAILPSNIAFNIILASLCAPYYIFSLACLIDSVASLMASSIVLISSVIILYPIAAPNS